MVKTSHNCDAFINLFYSLLNASTGSFLLAIFAGISPASIVKPKLINTSMVACVTETVACIATPDSAYIMLFIGSVNSKVIPTPIIPDIKPIMNVSALNTLEISFFDAPIALNIPISFVLSNTEMYVIIPIIIDDTTSDMLTNAINA